MQAPYFLVVEDDPILRRAVARAADGILLAKFAENGQQGVHLLRDATVPLFVLLDYLLPDCTGLDIVRHMRTDSRFANVPIVIFSSLLAPEHRARALSAGANDWVSKPDEPRELRLSVQALCRQWGGAAIAASSAT